jgi:lysophospholipid acyltransferase (LPLAT)-like uncharacterized protein
MKLSWEKLELVSPFKTIALYTGARIETNNERNKQKEKRRNYT